MAYYVFVWVCMYICNILYSVLCIQNNTSVCVGIIHIRTGYRVCWLVGEVIQSSQDPVMKLPSSSIPSAWHGQLPYSTCRFRVNGGTVRLRNFAASRIKSPWWANLCFSSHYFLPIQHLFHPYTYGPKPLFFILLLSTFSLPSSLIPASLPHMRSLRIPLAHLLLLLWMRITENVITKESA